MLAQLSIGNQTTDDSIELDQRNYVIGMLERNCIGVARIFEGTTWFMLLCMSLFVAFFVFDMTSNTAATIGVAVSPIILLLTTVKVFNDKSLIDIARTARKEVDCDELGGDDKSLKSSSLAVSSFSMDPGSFLEYLGNPLGGPTRRLSSASFASSEPGAIVGTWTGARSSNASAKSARSQHSSFAEGFNRDSYLEMTTSGVDSNVDSGSGYGAGHDSSGNNLKRAKGVKARATTPLGRPLISSNVPTIAEAKGRELSSESDVKAELNWL